MTSYDTEILHRNAVKEVDNARPCYRTRYDRHKIHTFARQQPRYIEREENRKTEKEKKEKKEKKREKLKNRQNERKTNIKGNKYPGKNTNSKGRPRREDNILLSVEHYGPGDRLLLCRGAFGSAQKVTLSRCLTDAWKI